MLPRDGRRARPTRGAPGVAARRGWRRFWPPPQRAEPQVAPDRGERAVLAHHLVVERGAPVPSLWHAPAHARGTPPLLVGAQGPRLAPPRALLRGVHGAERARGLARGVSPGHRRARPPLYRCGLGATAGGPALCLCLAHGGRQVVAPSRRC